MPVNLTTGLPGSGKTLWTISHVKALSEREGRPVYYLGIPDLVLPWTELKPDSLFALDQLPPGAIIVIDECQRYYSPRRPGAEVGPHLRYFETHRHQGHDVYLITQHPKLIDAHVRKLVEQHRHVLRHWGKEHARIWEWQEVNEKPDQRRTDEYGQRKKWDYPKDAYSWYRSTTMDTIQPRYPWHKWIYPVVLILAGVVGVSYFYNRHVGAQSEDLVPSDQVVPAVPPGGSAVVDASAPVPAYQALDPVSVAMMHLPVIAGVPGTAPIYWDTYKQVRDYPRIVGCVHIRNLCVCYSQQATRIDVPRSVCTSVVSGDRVFDHSRDPDGERDRVVARTEEQAHIDEALAVRDRATILGMRDGAAITSN